MTWIECLDPKWPGFMLGAHSSIRIWSGHQNEPVNYMAILWGRSLLGFGVGIENDLISVSGHRNGLEFRVGIAIELTLVLGVELKVGLVQGVEMSMVVCADELIRC